MTFHQVISGGIGQSLEKNKETLICKRVHDLVAIPPAVLRKPVKQRQPVLSESKGHLGSARRRRARNCGCTLFKRVSQHFHEIRSTSHRIVLSHIASPLYHRCPTMRGVGPDVKWTRERQLTRSWCGPAAQHDVNPLPSRQARMSALGRKQSLASVCFRPGADIGARLDRLDGLKGSGPARTEWQHAPESQWPLLEPESVA